MLAISTASLIPRDGDLEDAFVVGKELGLTAFEIGVLSTPIDLQRITPYMQNGDVRIWTLHNICSTRKVEPVDTWGDGLSSKDEDRRRWTVQTTLETIRIAEELSAKAVILHLGKVHVGRSGSKQTQWCREITERGLTSSLRQEIGRAYSARNASSAAALNCVTRSLEEILSYQSNVKLGLECRYFFNEIPNVIELEEIFSRFDTDRLYYWHDTGHAQIGEFLGICTHEEWLQRHRDRLLGVHVHDIVGALDHAVPGSGDIDWRMVKRYTPEDTMIIIEMHPGANNISADVKRSIHFLQEIGLT